MSSCCYPLWSKDKNTGKWKAYSVRKTKKKLRRKLWYCRKLCWEAETKAKNVMKDLHYKVAHYLLRRYKNILFPKFNTHVMLQGCLTKRTKRRMQMLASYQQRRRLVETANVFYPGRKVYLVNESYTSKLCGNCGHYNNIGSKEWYSCEQC